MRANGISKTKQIRNPHVDLSSDVGQKIYIAALERRVLFLSKRDVELRAVCELATGRPYDSFDPSTLSHDEIMEHVAQDMAQGLNISINKARDIIQENKIYANPE